MLTTLTTVLGLAPLAYESSLQALFLKPTVVTRVFGLAFAPAKVRAQGRFWSHCARAAAHWDDACRRGSYRAERWNNRVLVCQRRTRRTA